MSRAADRAGPADRQIASIGRVLARAFFDDPLTTLLLPKAATRAELLPWYFSALARYGALFGELQTTPEPLTGAAIWVRPGHEVTAEAVRQAGLSAAPLVLGAARWARFTRVVEHLQELRARHAARPHWYLVAVGVEPARQRRGIGRGLVEPVLARADAEGHACYLETFVRGNVAYYERLGFRLLAEAVEPSSALAIWVLGRDPRR